MNINDKSMFAWKIFREGEIVYCELFAWFYLMIYTQLKFEITGSVETLSVTGKSLCEGKKLGMKKAIWKKNVGSGVMKSLLSNLTALYNPIKSNE